MAYRAETWTLDEVCEPYELASSLEVFSFLMTVTALALEKEVGVKWHCRTCHRHDASSSLLHRPMHCGDPMEIESWLSLDHALRNIDRTVDLHGML